MFYISLPYFYKNYKFNQYFKKYIDNARLYSTDKLITDFSIDYVYGSFPWSLWNGHINNHQGLAVLNEEMKNIISNSNAPLRIDASNIFLSQTDYYDVHENATLKLLNGANVAYEISSINLMDYILTQNPYNKFIISDNIQFTQPFNPQIINLFSKEHNIEFINLGYNPFIEDIIDLAQLDNKNKLEVSIGHCQSCLRSKQLSCAQDEQKNIYLYSKHSVFSDCPYKYNVKNYYNEIKPYIQQGIHHFKIVTNSSNLEDFNLSIIRSFVKPEYQGECINGYYREISK